MEFIINTNMVWDTPPTARHQLAEALVKKGFKVTFITGNTFGKPGIKVIQINDFLKVITPSFPFSRRFRYRIPIINEFYQKWLYPKLQKLFNKEEAYVVTADFGGYLIANYFNKVIYFASDDYINNVKVPLPMKRYTYYTQKKLIKASKFTLATAQKLVTDFSEFNSQSFELPLGAPDFKVRPEKNILRERGGNIKVALLGFIDKVKTPVSLLNKILDQGNTELYLIGPIKDDILSKLEHKERVFPVGIQTGDALMETLLGMDVGIAPYYMTDSNTGRTPNKMWQYLAAGKPAVITNLPNVRHWSFPSGTVYKADKEKEFVDMIEKAYQEDSDKLVKERIHLAKNNSWEKRAELLLCYIDDKLKPLN